MSVRSTLAPPLLVLVVPLLPLAACGDDEDGAETSVPVGDAGGGPSGEGPCSSLDESSLEERFDVTVAPASDEVNGPTFCHFGIDGEPGYGFDVTALSETVETYDDAVAQMEADPGAADGTGSQPLDVGDEAVGFATSGLAYVVVGIGDQIVQVTANLPPDHALAADDDALLATTAELAGQLT
jgi:hypothetical protein